MSYQIAIGSSDGLNIDLKFGEADHFLIYKVDGKKYELYESRTVKRADDEKVHEKEDHCEEKGCSTKGCSGNGHGCGGASAVTDKVERIADCRCVVCAKIGFQAQKQFERKAISVFDVECSIPEALEKIMYYYEKMDNHQSLRG